MDPFKSTQSGFGGHHHGFILPVRSRGGSLHRRPPFLFGDDRREMSTVEILQHALDIASSATGIDHHQTAVPSTNPGLSSGQRSSHDDTEGTSVVNPRRRRHHFLHPPTQGSRLHHHHRRHYRSDESPSPSGTTNVLVDDQRSISPPAFRSQASLPDFGAVAVVEAASVSAAAVQSHPHAHHTVPEHEEELDNLHDSVSSLVVEDDLVEDDDDNDDHRHDTTRRQ